MKTSKCKKCGKKVSVINCGLYRNILVDAETVAVVPDMNGEQFVRFDGGKMRGREATEVEEMELRKPIEYVYRPHAKTCGVVE